MKDLIFHALIFVAVVLMFAGSVIAFTAIHTTEWMFGCKLLFSGIGCCAVAFLMTVTNLRKGR